LKIINKRDKETRKERTGKYRKAEKNGHCKHEGVTLLVVKREGGEARGFRVLGSIGRGGLREKGEGGVLQDRLIKKKKTLDFEEPVSKKKRVRSVQGLRWGGRPAILRKSGEGTFGAERRGLNFYPGKIVVDVGKEKLKMGAFVGDLWVGCDRGRTSVLIKC